MNDLSSIYARATSPFDKLRRTDADGEWWSARDLMPLLGYPRWSYFHPAVSRAILSCSNSGATVDVHFVHTRVSPELGANGQIAHVPLTPKGLALLGDIIERRDPKTRMITAS
jgi:hypothetical protein